MRLSHNKKTYNFLFICAFKRARVRKSMHCPVKLLLLSLATIVIPFFCLHWEDIHITRVRQNIVVPLVPEESAERLCGCIPPLLEPQIELKVEWNEKLFLLWVKTDGLLPPEMSFFVPNSRTWGRRFPDGACPASKPQVCVPEPG